MKRKNKILKKSIAWMLALALAFSTMFSGVHAKAAEFDKDNKEVYTYTESDGIARLNIDENHFQEFLDGGYADYWKTRTDLTFLDVVIDINEEGIVIPKEILNYVKGEISGSTYINVNVNGEKYEWSIERGTTPTAASDFSPYVTFSVPAELASYYPDGTQYVQVDSGYSGDEFGSDVRFSIYEMNLDGKTVNVSEIFSNLFGENTENFYLSNYEEDKSIKTVYKFTNSGYKNETGAPYVKFLNLFCPSDGKMVFSDQAVTGTNEDELQLASFDATNAYNISSSDTSSSDTSSSDTSSFDTSLTNTSSGLLFGEGVYDSDGVCRYTYEDRGYEYIVRIPIASLQWMIDTGTLNDIVQEHKELTYTELYITEKGYTVSKDLFNILGQYGIHDRMMIDLPDEFYSWGFDTSKDFYVTEDFDPYITYDTQRTVDAYFEEGTTYYVLHTGFIPNEYGSHVMLALRQLIIDGKSMSVGDIFSNFFNKYCTSELAKDEEWCYFYNYPLNYPDCPDKGYFYLSNFDSERGGLTGAAKDEMWNYYRDKTTGEVITANVEMNEMIFATSDTFVISDQPPIGSNVEDMHEFAESWTNGQTVEGSTEYGKDNLVDYFSDKDDIDAETAASADMMDTAKELKKDLDVEVNDVQFEFSPDTIDKSIAFEPDVKKNIDSDKIDSALEEKLGGEDKLDGRSHEYVEFKNEYSKEKGELPGNATVTYPVDESKFSPGDQVEVLYYNEKEHEMETLGKATVNEKHQVAFTLEHFSSYAIVGITQKEYDKLESAVQEGTEKGDTAASDVAATAKPGTAETNPTVSATTEPANPAASVTTAPVGSVSTATTTPANPTAAVTTAPVGSVSTATTTPANPAAAATTAPANSVSSETPGTAATAKPGTVVEASPAAEDTVANAEKTETQVTTEKALEKGDTYTDTKAKTTYVVTTSGGTGKTVEYAKTTAKKTTSIVVPATVKVNGIAYKVTSIAANAFKNQKTVKKITIGTNIKQIGKNAFSGCSKLKTLTIKSTKLTSKTLKKNAFKGISKKTVIKVPKKKLKAYKKLFKKKGLSSGVVV